MSQINFRLGKLSKFTMNNNNATQRLQEELVDISEDPPENCTIGPEENIFHWTGLIDGPKDSPYETGSFFIDIKFPKDYPYKAPNVTFLTKIYHPNISSTGEICLGVLKQKWHPSISIKSLLLSLQYLLSHPNSKDPLVAEIGEQDQNNHEEFLKTAREWTKRYAQVN